MKKPLVIGDQFKRNLEVIECLGPRIDGIKGHLFAFFRHRRNASGLPTFFTLRIGTMRKRGWQRTSGYVATHAYLPDVSD